MYDPNTGRFLSPDPIGFRGGGVNLYRYVSNNPVLYNDPSGKFAAEGGLAFLVCAGVLYAAADIATEGPASNKCQEEGGDKKTCDEKAKKNYMPQNVIELLQ
jgi:uncharacterized protein RhaS with RHS repeats